MRSAILFGLCLAGCRSTDRIDALIAQLDAEAIEDRDAVSAELRAAGTPALPRLRAARLTTAEAQARRDELVRRIELDEKLRELCPEPARARVHYRGTLGGAAAALTSRFGVTVVVSHDVESLPAALALDHASLGEALSAVGAWDRLAPRTYQLWNSARSTQYASGRFCVRARVRHSTLALDWCHDGETQPLPLARIEITHGADSDGRTVELHRLPVYHQLSCSVRGGAAYLEQAELLSEWRWTPASSRLSVVRGYLTVRFPIHSMTASFVPSANSPQRVGSFDMCTNVWASDGCTLTVDVADPFLAGDTLKELRRAHQTPRLVAESGEVVGALLRDPMVSVPSDPSLRINVQSWSSATWRELRWEVVDDVIEKRIPFVIRDIAR